MSYESAVALAGYLIDNGVAFVSSEQPSNNIKKESAFIGTLSYINHSGDSGEETVFYR